MLLLLLFGFLTKHLAMMVPISCPTVCRATSPRVFQIDWHRPAEEKFSSLFVFYHHQIKWAPQENPRRTTRFKNRQPEEFKPKKKRRDKLNPSRWRKDPDPVDTRGEKKTSSSDWRQLIHFLELLYYIIPSSERHFYISRNMFGNSQCESLSRPS